MTVLFSCFFNLLFNVVFLFVFVFCFFVFCVPFSHSLISHSISIYSVIYRNNKCFPCFSQNTVNMFRLSTMTFYLVTMKKHKHFLSSRIPHLESGMASFKVYGGDVNECRY